MQAQKGDSKSKLAVAERDSGKIHIYDVRSGSDEPLARFEVHRAPVVAMRYNAAHDSVVSVDQKGSHTDVSFNGIYSVSASSECLYDRSAS